MKCKVKLERVIVESTTIEVDVPDGTPLMPEAGNRALDAAKTATLTWTQQSVDGPMFSKLLSPVIAQE